MRRIFVKDQEELDIIYKEEQTKYNGSRNVVWAGLSHKEGLVYKYRYKLSFIPFAVIKIYKSSNNTLITQTKEWKAIRAAVLRKGNNQCVECYSEENLIVCRKSRSRDLPCSNDDYVGWSNLYILCRSCQTARFLEEHKVKQNIKVSANVCKPKLPRKKQENVITRLKKLGKVNVLIRKPIEEEIIPKETKPKPNSRKSILEEVNARLRNMKEEVVVSPNKLPHEEEGMGLNMGKAIGKSNTRGRYLPDGELNMDRIIDYGDQRMAVWEMKKIDELAFMDYWQSDE